jgi:L-lactate dehydrogenase (cytochrome)/(S)-mandelate dehydrogenase
LATNAAGFLKYHLLPKYLVDVSARDQSTDLFGQTFASPFGFGPTGTMGLFRPGSELMLAQAAAEADVPYVMSGGSNASLEDAAKIAPKNTWYQLYAARDTAICEDLIKRSGDAGLGALMVTVDVPVRTRRERNIRNGFSYTHRLKASILLEALTHPGWIIDYLRNGGVPPLANWVKYAPAGADAVGVADFFNTQVPAPAQTFRELETYRKMWPRTLIVKGIMDPEDAVRAADLGVDGILVSNHGGRQLDRAAAPIDMFPEINAAVGDRVTLMLDSGIRRGSDVLVALCLGAKFVFLGRPGLYAVSACGLEGARHLIEILRAEIDLTMGQMGCPTIADLSADRVRRRDVAVATPIGAEASNAAHA